MSSPSPFHEGEQRVQDRLGVREEIEPWARRVVRPLLPEEHRDFYGRLPFLVVAARDADGRPWATLLAGEPGFVSSPDPSSMHIAAVPSRGDALTGALEVGDDVGFLGIELESRRRNRVNGRVFRSDGEALIFAVEQSFGNCPQYITERSWRHAEPQEQPAPARRASELSAEQSRFIGRADTFFIATGWREPGRGSETFGMDASHRGGAPGFVEVRDSRHLVFPDYAGNNHFNTIGNLVLDPRVGIVFVDFERGDLLQISGRARIDWDSPEVGRIPGARRLVGIEIDEIVEIPGALPLRWDSQAGSVRELRVIEARSESEDVTSFCLAARDGSPLPRFIAGQYLPMELEIPGQDARTVRTYSLSSAPGDPVYRVSVKRHSLGLASRHLHDRIAEGAVISARAPQGDFVLDPSSARPVVLVSAGVGLTPLVSMLHELVAEGTRPVWFVHGARDGLHHPLRREVEQLAASTPDIRIHVAYSQPRQEDEIGRDFQSRGRVDGTLIENLVPGLEADFYLCGPLPFMASVQSQLETLGVPDEQIHSESFGPAG
jgi:ferredoxin-NADP reductase/predicted pyridoxine 5'-phosphate oxidase superfamily flavin-nucleotide-binding protein